MIVRYEDGKWIYNIGVYFGILKDLNNDLIELIKYDAHYNENIEIKKKNKEYLDWIINTDMLIDIIIALNEVFIKIQEKLKKILMVILKH